MPAATRSTVNTTRSGLVRPTPPTSRRRKRSNADEDARKRARTAEEDEEEDEDEDEEVGTKTTDNRKAKGGRPGKKAKEVKQRGKRLR